MCSLRVAVLQHVACEPPAAYGPALASHARVDSVLLGRDALPALEAYDGIVAMGGPMGVYDTDQHPWLLREVDALRAALAAGVPVWGVCLGAQLLAAAAGSGVRPGPLPEAGIGRVTLTDAAGADPVFAGLPAQLTVLQWHQDTFDVPAGAQLVATGEAYPNQAFRYGLSYGLQFHLEASWALAAEWLQLDAYRASLERAGGPGSADRLRNDLLAAEMAMAGTAELLITRWLGLLGH